MRGPLHGDLRTLFINVQHPGELPLEHPPRNDPKNPKAASSEAAAMNADSIQYALETDWPVGAAGFEPLHLEIRSAELHPAPTGFRRRSGAPLIRDAQVRVPPPGLRVLANSDSNMQRFESCRPNRPVRL